MGIKISTIKGLTQEGLALWRNGDLFIDFKNNNIHTYGSALSLYKEHTYEENNNHISFRSWCLENELYFAYSGNDNYGWETIELDNGETILIVARKF